MRGIPAIILALILIGFTAGPVAAQEYGVDRPGSDYANFELNRPAYQDCQNACFNDPRCKAWTYVKPGLQGARARCWLKHAVPQGYRHDCCVSGVKSQGGGSAGDGQRCNSNNDCPNGICLLGVCASDF